MIVGQDDDVGHLGACKQQQHQLSSAQQQQQSLAAAGRRGVVPMQPAGGAPAWMVVVPAGAMEATTRSPASQQLPRGFIAATRRTDESQAVPGAAAPTPPAAASRLLPT